MPAPRRHDEGDGEAQPLIIHRIGTEARLKIMFPAGPLRW